MTGTHLIPNRLPDITISTEDGENGRTFYEFRLRYQHVPTRMHHCNIRLDADTVMEAMYAFQAVIQGDAFQAAIQGDAK